MKLFGIKLYIAEKLTLVYVLATMLIAFVMVFRGFPVMHLIYVRFIILAVIFGLAYIDRHQEKRTLTRLLRFIIVGGLLMYWYPETFEFNRYFNNLDHTLASWEYFIFRSQPSLSFSESFSSSSFSEWMNMGYFSYYILIAGVSLYFYFFDRHFFHSFFFTVLFSFFVYYIVFIFFPTAGPQYYFTVIGSLQANTGNYPPIGDYFVNNYFTVDEDAYRGFFKLLVKSVQYFGERPTGAFPSSHVGITTVIMILIVRHRSFRLALILLPIYILLVLSTVYIKAHYVIDVFAGFISALILYVVSIKIILRGNEKSIFDRQQITPNKGFLKFFFGE